MVTRTEIATLSRATCKAWNNWNTRGNVQRKRQRRKEKELLGEGVAECCTVYYFAVASLNNSRRRRWRQDLWCCFKFNEIGLSPLDRVTASLCLKKRIISHGKQKTSVQFSFLLFHLLISLHSSSNNKPQPFLEHSSLTTSRNST
jgi:hypothetical protein